MHGGTIKGVLGELLGRQCGMSHGKGGSMHIFTPTFFSGKGIVGAQVPVGAVVAFAQRYRGEKHCTFALYGDGASNQGQVFESFNVVRSTRPLYFSLHVNTSAISGQTLEPSLCLCLREQQVWNGTSSARSSLNTEYFTRGDKIRHSYVITFLNFDTIQIYSM